jgi:hypothetical protein
MEVRVPERLATRWLPAAALAIALLAAAAVVGLPLAQPTRTGATPAAAATVPPDRIATVPTALADGSSYALRYVLGPGSSVGTSLAANGSSFRLVQVVDGRMVAEVRRLPTASGAQYDGFTAADGRLYWIETVIGEDGVSRSQLWTATIGRDLTVTEPRSLLADMGLIIVYDSATDLIVADGTISWVVAANPTRPGTVLRSMPVGGGPTTDRGFNGPWRQIGRPWLASAAVGAASMLNTDTGQIYPVQATASDTVECGPQWCHFTVQSSDGPVRLGLMRPDGTQRTRLAGPGARFDNHDPALPGRYELFSETGGDLTQADRRLKLYDITTATTTLVETGPGGPATSRGGYAWWISGDYRSPTWHVLDLSTLA